jgi:hypothetical protein
VDASVCLARVARAEPLDQPGRAQGGGGALLALALARAVERGVEDG